MLMKKNEITESIIMVLYFGLYLTIGLSLLIKQPFGSPPDEYNRYLIPQYIAENGTLPNGFEESIRIGGYGFSYGFQPILPYMFQGYAMRFVRLFTDSPDAMLTTARGINLILGLLTAWVVLLLSKKWFRDRRFGWIFAFLATFLPQSIFVHSYVNTDSCCMLSIAVILYGLTKGLKERFCASSCIILSTGIILCSLSYYNAYGYILSSILIFFAFFLSASDGRLKFDTQNFLKKGCFISAIVLLGISWWFIRSAILYDGDFLGLRTRNECAVLYALPGYRPGTRITWQSQGYSIWDMISGSDFWTLSILSFIGIYGPMTIITSIWVYRFYRMLFLAGTLFCIFIPGKFAGSDSIFQSAAVSGKTNLSGKANVSGEAIVSGNAIVSGEAAFRDSPENSTGNMPGKRRGLEFFFHINMVFCILMPLILSMIYSYSTDYQPQGRYLLPSLLPLCYYTVRGLEKLWNILPQALPGKKEHSVHDGNGRSRGLTCFSVLICAIIAGMLLLTVYGYVFPYYNANPIA